MRDSVKDFTEQMESRLSANKSKDDIGWKKSSKEALSGKVISNLTKALGLINTNHSEKALESLADAGNYLMMIHDNYKPKRKKL